MWFTAESEVQVDMSHCVIEGSICNVPTFSLTAQISIPSSVLGSVIDDGLTLDPSGIMNGCINTHTVQMNVWTEASETLTSPRAVLGDTVARPKYLLSFQSAVLALG